MTAPNPAPHQLMTVREVAAALRVSRATVYRLIHSGVLPGKRVGKSVRVVRHIVEDYLRNAGIDGGSTAGASSSRCDDSDGGPASSGAAGGDLAPTPPAFPPSGAS